MILGCFTFLRISTSIRSRVSSTSFLSITLTAYCSNPSVMPDLGGLRYGKVAHFVALTDLFVCLFADCQYYLRIGRVHIRIVCLNWFLQASIYGFLAPWKSCLCTPPHVRSALAKAK